ncbi:MAG: DMT family transporter [Rhodospirillaceae bacterium]|nr:DMT family transporter [Rhodospirillaceae bacterium]MBT6675712.1 DMT family transporter [Rhodospirillaceae bacterium]MBT6976720.1 DMT family transporter [Rhodospirillaceae bacterium]MBT7633322.1 DMT family transporter [Rhodospirillaceae bacterium]MBT7835015.1 DMT family transporter [Rhodospirillaceae bacterium]
MTAAEMRVRVLDLPDNTRGALWIILGCVMFSAMTTVVKLLGGSFDSFQLAFFRALFGLFAVMPFFFRFGLGVVRTRRLGLQLIRAVCGACAMLCGFYAITHLPLADAVFISYARALFIIPLAVLFLGEVVRLRRWTATAVGFVGVIIMLRPGGEIEPATLVAVLGAFLVATVTIMIKKLSTTESPESMLFYFGAVSSVVALGPALLVWRTPTLAELSFLMAIGALGAAGQYCIIRAYRIGEATALLPFDYTRLLFAGAIGFLLFAEIPDNWTVTGAIIVVAATLYIGIREARLGRKVRPSQPAIDPPAVPRD